MNTIQEYIRTALTRLSQPEQDLVFDAENALAEVIHFAEIKSNDRVAIIGSSGNYYLSIIANII